MSGAQGWVCTYIIVRITNLPPAHDVVAARIDVEEEIMRPDAVAASSDRHIVVGPGTVAGLPLEANVCDGALDHVVGAASLSDYDVTYDVAVGRVLVGLESEADLLPGLAYGRAFD